MDRGEGQEQNLASADGLDGVAAGASARVGEILEEAEQHGRDVNAEAERAAAEIHSGAEAEVEQIVAEAREAAREAARERAEQLAALQAALTARGPAVIEGLEGAGVTRARLEAVIEALGAAAARVHEEAEAGDPASPGDSEAPAEAERAEEAGEGEAEAAAEVVDAEPDTAEAEAAVVDAEVVEEGPVVDDPVAAAEDLARPLAEAEPEPQPQAEDASSNGALAEDHHGATPGNGAVAYHGPLPEGAPLARKPMRSRERDARFAALLLAVQGRPRGEVEDHLRHEYGFADCEPILDEVFGRTPA